MEGEFLSSPTPFPPSHFIYLFFSLSDFNLATHLKFVFILSSVNVNLHSHPHTVLPPLSLFLFSFLFMFLCSIFATADRLCPFKSRLDWCSKHSQCQNLMYSLFLSFTFSLSFAAIYFKFLSLFRFHI